MKRKEKELINKHLESFKSFMIQREEAAQAYVTGNPTLLESIATSVSPATFFGPGGNFEQGAEKVLSSFNQGAAMFGSDSNTHFEILHMSASDTLAYWVGIQRAKVQLKEGKDKIPMDLRVTEIFQRENEEWKLIHRHADFLALKG